MLQKWIKARVNYVDGWSYTVRGVRFKKNVPKTIKDRDLYDAIVKTGGFDIQNYYEEVDEEVKPEVKPETESKSDETPDETPAETSAPKKGKKVKKTKKVKK